MNKIALVFCYLNIFSLTQNPFDLDEWKIIFTEQLLNELKDNNIKTNILMDIDEKSIAITLSNNCFGNSMENFNLALEIEIFSNDIDSMELKSHMYLIKPIILKIIENINMSLYNIDIAQIPDSDFVISNNKFYTEVNSETTYKIVQIIEADLHYLYDIEEIDKIL